MTIGQDYLACEKAVGEQLVFPLLWGSASVVTSFDPALLGPCSL